MPDERARPRCRWCGAFISARRVGRGATSCSSCAPLDGLYHELHAGLTADDAERALHELERETDAQND